MLCRLTTYGLSALLAAQLAALAPLPSYAQRTPTPAAGHSTSASAHGSPRATQRRRIRVDACGLLTDPEIEAMLRGPVLQKVKDPPKSCHYQLGRQRTTLTISSLPVQVPVQISKPTSGAPQRHVIHRLGDAAWWQSLSGDTASRKTFGSIVQLEVIKKSKPAHLSIVISSTDEENTTLKAAKQLAQLAVERM